MIEIDFGMILAQIVTFAIAVFILWKLAWKPLVSGMEQRKNAIAKNISDAEKIKQETEKLKSEYAAMIAGIDKKAQEMLANSSAAAEKNKQQLITAARDEAKNILEMAKKQISQEKESVKSDLKREFVPIAFSIAEKILGKNVDRDAQSKMVEEFLTGISDIKQ